MSKLSDELYDSLKDHIILKCGDGNRPESNIYDCWAPVEIKSILEDAHVHVHTVGYAHNKHSVSDPGAESTVLRVLFRCVDLVVVPCEFGKGIDVSCCYFPFGACEYIAFFYLFIVHNISSSQRAD